MLALLLICGGIAFAIVRESALVDRFGKHNLLAHKNLFEESALAVVLLVAPFVGGCNAFRLSRSANRSAKIFGWLFLVTFSLFFLQTALVYSKYF